MRRENSKVIENSDNSINYPRAKIGKSRLTCQPVNPSLYDCSSQF